MIHATDSAWIGWTAKSAAAKAEAPILPVALRSAPKSRHAASAWSAALVAWKPPGSGPKSSTSSISESQVRGCQFAAYRLWNAQATLRGDRPARTKSLSVTYMRSSDWA